MRNLQSPVWEGPDLTGLWLKIVSALEDLYIGYCLSGYILGVLAGEKARQLTKLVELTPRGDNMETKYMFLKYQHLFLMVHIRQ